ncbi:tetratricopeptide repeat protein [Iningainema tapete]|uniref:TPR repeat-containing protein n=1 Tax=Iningainema tapete BLCC-T55 TaxID=2748662 RepID=A0A8J6XE11_9CYAN|nr:hypothetical protein [Iningainema tapete]MBD2770742.1 hypothetical protein [Iningainema tapete BLCC-T55]
MLRRLSVTITATATLWLLCSSLTLAQTKKPKQPDKFLPNPLEITTPDPLLPQPQQPLTPAERQKLEAALDELNQQATAKLQAGDQVTAFEIWNRELRLRRAFGAIAEVQALSRVGAIAWRNNERQQLQYITQRLQTVQTQAKSQNTLDLQLLQALGQAYQQVREPKLALSVYEQILATVRTSQDAAAEIETLKQIGEIHLSWFDYPSAAATYEKLLSNANNSGDRMGVMTYLQQLAYIYEQAKQPQQSVNIRNKLAEIYLQENNLTQLAALKLAIGSDYESLAQKDPSLLQNAFKNYQEAYTTAWQSEQYVRAGEALQKLIALYRSQGQIEEALQTSQILIKTQELAGNFYGLMNAYDQIGQINLQRKDYPQAQAAFQKGLQLAQQLKYDETYFTEQIQKLSGQTLK